MTWMEHLAKFRKDHPEMKGAQVMKEAAKSYKKADGKAQKVMKAPKKQETKGKRK